MGWRGVFSLFPYVGPFRKAQKKSVHPRQAHFSTEADGSCYAIPFMMEAPAWRHLGTPGPLRERERFPDQTNKGSLLHLDVDCEKQSEWSFALLDWALPYQLLFWEVKRYLLHLLGKWEAACFGRDCYCSEVLSTALYFRLYVFTSAWTSSAITALWLNDWNKCFLSIWGWVQM